MAPDAQTYETVEPRQAVTETLAGLGQADVELFGRHLAEHATWEMMGQDYLPTGSLFDGREAILRDLVALGFQIYDMSTMDITLRNLVADGPVVIAEFTLTATTARGRPYENVGYVMVFTVVDGKIESVREYTNTLYAKRVIFDD